VIDVTKSMAKSLTKQEMVAALAEQGYCFLSRSAICSSPEWAWARNGLERLSREFDDLDVDEHVIQSERDGYRGRRYGRMLILCDRHSVNSEIIPIPDEVLPRAGGDHTVGCDAAEQAAPIKLRTLTDPRLLSLIALDHSVLPLNPHAWRVDLDFSQIRQLASYRIPVGRRRDGPKYVALHLMGDAGRTANIALLYLHDREDPIAHCTVSECFDTLLVDESMVEFSILTTDMVADDSSLDLLFATFYPLDRADSYDVWHFGSISEPTLPTGSEFPATPWVSAIAITSP
jgi:2OG-Fe dioxygenase